MFDEAGTQESRQLLQRFENSQDFDITARVFNDAELNQAIVAGKARVGIKIPRDYSQKLEAGQTAQILVLIDGTESSVAAEAVNVGNALALRESLERVLGSRDLPVDARPPGHDDALGNLSSTLYDQAGRVTSSIDARGNRTTYTFDAANRLTSTTNPNSETTSFTLDAAGRIQDKVHEQAKVAGLTFCQQPLTNWPA